MSIFSKENFSHINPIEGDKNKEQKENRDSVASFVKEVRDLISQDTKDIYGSVNNLLNKLNPKVRRLAMLSIAGILGMTSLKAQDLILKTDSTGHTNVIKRDVSTKSRHNGKTTITTIKDTNLGYLAKGGHNENVGVLKNVEKKDTTAGAQEIDINAQLKKEASSPMVRLESLQDPNGQYGFTYEGKVYKFATETNLQEGAKILGLKLGKPKLVDLAGPRMEKRNNLLNQVKSLTDPNGTFRVTDKFDGAVYLFATAEKAKEAIAIFNEMKNLK
ncbi:MAG: hypothetical protein WCO35_03745 [Candidatus Nomurabacteria bacterium]